MTTVSRPRLSFAEMVKEIQEDIARWPKGMREGWAEEYARRSFASQMKQRPRPRGAEGRTR